MPTDSCHPQAPHKKLRVADTLVSSLMIERALDAITRHVKKLDREHDIPYLAGYSKDGKTIYIDRHLPRTFRYKGREIDIDRYLILHESVEKALIDGLGLHYQHAHQIACRAEEAAVRAERVSWRAYDQFTQKYIRDVWHEDLQKLPADLDQKPYRDEHDLDLLKRMKEAIAEGRVKPAARARLTTSIDRTMEEVSARKSSRAGKARPPAAPVAKGKATGRQKKPK